MTKHNFALLQDSLNALLMAKHGEWEADGEDAEELIADLRRALREEREVFASSLK